jgi:predicted molibdopterin-dependent oxidoreductase YjgC
LPEETSDALDAYRLPLSAIRDAELVVVLGLVPVAERAPVVDLWLRAARRNGAKIVEAGDALTACRELSGAASELGGRLRGSDRAILIWSADEGAGGGHLAALAHELGFGGKERCGAFHLPATPNGRGVAEAWAAAGEGEDANPEPIGLLVVSGDEAAADPSVRALAERAERVLTLSMFQGLSSGWSDLVLPGTSYLERDGTYVNLEGRLQRLRRAVIPPAPDELAWISSLAERFGVEISPHASAVFAELSALIYDGLPFGEVGERAVLRVRSEAERTELPSEDGRAAGSGRGLTLVRYKPLFSGPAVERVPELQFQRPAAEVELAREDASNLGVADGDPVTLSHDGASVSLEARAADLPRGFARVATEHAGTLQGRVEVARA